MHGLNETEVSLVVTSHELLPKFKKMLEHCPKIKTIIVMEDQIFPLDTSGYKPGVQIIPFRSVVKTGETSHVESVPPSSDSPAIIMTTDMTLPVQLTCSFHILRSYSMIPCYLSL